MSDTVSSYQHCGEIVLMCSSNSVILSVFSGGEREAVGQVQRKEHGCWHSLSHHHTPHLCRQCRQKGDLGKYSNCHILNDRKSKKHLLFL